ncbi:uncharacterized protein LOC129734404 [Falco cherrug]|uniref:uncharacterized protein LOC129734404 n=1 Tax=Falco cherrug TaxID=345164 RepID=UPI0024784212|nr:uncharacterized protein LOC129734404 [Falco cherrug]
MRHALHSLPSCSLLGGLGGEHSPPLQSPSGLRPAHPAQSLLPLLWCWGWMSFAVPIRPLPTWGQLHFWGRSVPWCQDHPAATQPSQRRWDPPCRRPPVLPGQIRTGHGLSHSCLPPFPASPSCCCLTIAGFAVPGLSLSPQPPIRLEPVPQTGPVLPKMGAPAPSFWFSCILRYLGSAWHLERTQVGNACACVWPSPLPPALVGLRSSQHPVTCPPGAEPVGGQPCWEILAGSGKASELLDLGQLPPPRSRGAWLWGELGVWLSQDHLGSLGAGLGCGSPQQGAIPCVCAPRSCADGGAAPEGCGSCWGLGWGGRACPRLLPPSLSHSGCTESLLPPPHPPR